MIIFRTVLLHLNNEIDNCCNILIFVEATSFYSSASHGPATFHRKSDLDLSNGYLVWTMSI